MDPITSRLVSTMNGITTIRSLRKVNEIETEYENSLNLQFWISYAELSVNDFTTLLIDLATNGTLNILVIFAMFFPHVGIEAAFSPLLAFGATVGFAFSLGTVLVTNAKHAEAILDLHKIPAEAQGSVEWWETQFATNFTKNFGLN